MEAHVSWGMSMQLRSPLLLAWVALGLCTGIPLAAADDAADQKARQYAEDKEAAKQLIRARNKAEVDRALAASDTGVRRGDRVAAPLSSTQTGTSCPPGSNVCTTQTINQADGVNTGQLSPSAAIRIQNANASLNAATGTYAQASMSLEALRARNPDAVRDAEREVADEEDAPLKFIVGLVVVPLLYVLTPATGTFAVSGRILGPGNRPGVSGIQGDGMVGSLTLNEVASRHHLGIAAEFETEIGGYRDHGVIGSIGGGLGPGVRWGSGYLGMTIGMHWTASLYRSAKWVPLLAQFGVRGRRWGLNVSGGYGWRPALPDDGSPEARLTSKGPWGTRSSLFRLSVQRKRLQVGFTFQDLDGNMIGSFNFGYSWMGTVDQ